MAKTNHAKRSFKKAQKTISDTRQVLSALLKNSPETRVDVLLQMDKILCRLGTVEDHEITELEFGWGKDQ